MTTFGQLVFCESEAPKSLTTEQLAKNFAL